MTPAPCLVFRHLSQHFAPAELPTLVRQAAGQSLRRTAALHQLALLGALACLPEPRRQRPTALLWQTCSGPRQETLTLLEEVCQGTAEPMPYDFLATQPALAGPQIQPFVPGLSLASHLPLASEPQSAWGLMLVMAQHWLAEGRYAQVLCAQLDVWPDAAQGHWLALEAPGGAPPDALARLSIAPLPPGPVLADRADLPSQLATWLQTPDSPPIGLATPFARSPVFHLP